MSDTSLPLDDSPLHHHSDSGHDRHNNHMMSDNMTVDSWGGGTQATSTTVPLQRDDQTGSWYCPKHVDCKFRDRTAVCPMCDAEFQTNREDLKERQRHVQERLQELSFESSTDILYDLQASMQHWKPSSEAEAPADRHPPPSGSKQQQQQQPMQQQQVQQPPPPQPHHYQIPHSTTSNAPPGTAAHEQQYYAPQQQQQQQQNASVGGYPSAAAVTNGGAAPAAAPVTHHPGMVVPASTPTAANNNNNNAASSNANTPPLPPRHPGAAPSPPSMAHHHPQHATGGPPPPQQQVHSQQQHHQQQQQQQLQQHMQMPPQSHHQHMPPPSHHSPYQMHHHQPQPPPAPHHHHPYAAGPPLPPPLPTNPSASSSGGPPPMPPHHQSSAGGASTASMDALSLQIQRMQQMQDWMLWQKETECQSLRSRLEEANHELQQLRVDNALLQEKLHQQEQRMQHELRLIKLAALKQRRSSSTGATTALLTNGMGPGATSASNQIVVSPSPGDFMNSWVSQQPHHTSPHHHPALQRERTLSTDDHPAESIEEPPHMAVSAHDDFDLGNSNSHGGGGGGGGASSFFSSTQSSSRAGSSTDNNGPTTGPGPAPAPNHQQRQSRNAPPPPASSSSSIRPNESFPPFFPSQPNEHYMADGSNHGPGGGGHGGMNPRSEDSVTTDSEEGKDAFDTNSVTWPSENSLGPKPRQKASMYKHKAGPLTTHNSHPGGLGSPARFGNQHSPESGDDASSRPTSMPSHRQNGGADVLAASSNASVSSADMYVKEDIVDAPPPVTTTKPASSSIRQLPPQEQSRYVDESEHNDEDADDELDDDIDDTTNHMEQPSDKSSSSRTYGTSLYGAHMQQQHKHGAPSPYSAAASGAPSPSRSTATSSSTTSSSTPSSTKSKDAPANSGPGPLMTDRSGVPAAVAAAAPPAPTPRVPPPVKVSFVDEDSASVGHTVASSTFGEDRYKVVNQTILDPYGDRGTYTGVILRSTGMPHGSGEMLYQEDKRVYAGEWRHGRWHGFGRAYFANGDSYEGEYRFDQRHGRGIYNWADGRIYDGYFREDKRHGRGKFVWPDGAVYEGEFRNGQREGQGIYIFSDGGKYEGSWRDGRYSGFGICSWEDGRCYKGYACLVALFCDEIQLWLRVSYVVYHFVSCTCSEWFNGMAHGKGVETFADGTIRHEGLWREDEPVPNASGKMMV